MRKLAAFLIAAALLAGLCSCGKAADTWQEQYDLGVRYLSEGNYREAVLAFNAAIEIDPARADAYAQLAEAYLALNDPVRALETLERGITATGDEGLRARAEELAAPETPPSGPRTERVDADDGSYRLDSYDEAGSLTRTEGYHPDGTLFYYWLYYYNEVQDLERLERYRPDGTPRGHYIYFYDGDRTLTHREAYDPDNGSVDYRYLYTYDGSGRLVREEVRRIGSPLYSVNYYDEAGNLIRKEWCDLSDTMTNYLLYYYSTAGVLERVEWCGLDGSISGIEYYDETGNETRLESYGRDGSLSTYTLYILDEAGNQTRSENYRADGSMYSYHLYYYAYVGAYREIRTEVYDPDGAMSYDFVYYYDEEGTQFEFYDI